MNLSNVITVYLKELRDSLRDRRTVMSMIIIPTLVMPLLMFGVGKIASGIFSKAKKEVATIMVIGAEHSPRILSALEASPRLRIVPTADNWKLQISEKKIRAAVAIPAGFDEALEQGRPSDVVMYRYDGELKSELAVDKMEKILDQLRQDRVQASLAARNLPASLIEPFAIRSENVAPPEKVTGNKLGGLVPYMIIILCFTGAMYPAMDLTAGEKERGTMETLLCSPVARVDIVLGKFLMVLTSSIAAMTLALASMGISLAVITGSFSGGKKVEAAVEAGTQAASAMPMIDPVGVLGVLAMVLPVAVLFSAVLFTVALFAKSYKEAQSYVAPLIFVVLMPAIIGMLPGIDLNVRLAFMPILNLSLVCKEMLSGVWHWHYIAIIFGSTCVYAGIALALAVKMFKREDVIFRV
jgi:sodium transport system permease protein